MISIDVSNDIIILFNIVHLRISKRCEEYVNTIQLLPLLYRNLPLLSPYNLRYYITVLTYIIAPVLFLSLLLL